MDKLSNSEIDKKEKDRLADLKMQEMKRKNEAWAKRYEEIEADKKNSDIVRNLASLKLNDQNKIVIPEKPRVHDRNENPRKTFSQDTKRKSDRALHHIPRQQTDCQHSNSLGDAARKSAPPPDPRFNFLDDPDRFGSTNNSRGEKHESYSRRIKTRSAAENTSWNRSNDWGVFSQGLNKSDAKFTGAMATSFSRHKPFSVRRFSQGEAVPTKRQMEMNMTGLERVRYQAWLRERERVDAERLARQRTANGGWRREWDLDKNFEGSENDDRSGGVYRNRTCRFMNDATAHKSQTLPKTPHGDTSRPRSVLTNKSRDSRQRSAVPGTSGSHLTHADHTANEKKTLALDSNIPEVLIKRQAPPIEDLDNLSAAPHNELTSVSVAIVKNDAGVSNSQLPMSSTFINRSEGNDGLDETVRSEQLIAGGERVKEDKVGDEQDDEEQWEDVEEGKNNGQENETCEFRDAVEVLGRECQ